MKQSRQPRFYRDLQVPDSVDGRFEMLALHVFLVLRRLKGEPTAADFCQQLFDVMFEDMDVSLREMGAGDMGVGKRVKAMAQAFYGRIASYDSGLDGSDETLCGALKRNLYRTAAPDDRNLTAMAVYMRAQAAHLGEIAADRIVAAEFSFAPTP